MLCAPERGVEVCEPAEHGVWVSGGGGERGCEVLQEEGGVAGERGDGVGARDGCEEGWEAGGEVGVEVALDAVRDELAEVGLVGGGGGGGRLDQLEDQCVPGRGGESEAVDVAVVGPEAGEEDVGAHIEAGREGGGERGGLGHGGRAAVVGGGRRWGQ